MTGPSTHSYGRRPKSAKARNRAVIDAPDVGPVALNTSSRLITIFTGWPDLRAAGDDQGGSFGQHAYAVKVLAGGHVECLLARPGKGEVLRLAAGLEAAEILALRIKYLSAPNATPARVAFLICERIHCNHRLRKTLRRDRLRGSMSDSNFDVRRENSSL
jgi:hypothetical protein